MNAIEDAQKAVQKAQKKLAKARAANRDPLLVAAAQMMGQRERRIRELQGRVNALDPAKDPSVRQGGLSYELARKQLAKGEMTDRLTQLGLNPATIREYPDETPQERALARASAPAVRRAQGAAINNTASARGQLVDIRDGRATQTYPREQLQLDSQARIQRLEGELRKAMNGSDMQRASQLSYELTRARLVDGHRRGVI